MLRYVVGGVKACASGEAQGEIPQSPKKRR